MSVNADIQNLNLAKMYHTFQISILNYPNFTFRLCDSKIIIMRLLMNFDICNLSYSQTLQYID